MKSAPLLSALLLLGSACHARVSSVPTRLPEAFAPVRYSNCYNGAGFFRTDKAKLTARMPTKFVPRDGSVLGPAHQGYGLVALILLACPHAGGTDRVAIIATPIEDPSFASDLRAVRWNWYEFGRLVGDQARLEQLTKYGYSVRQASLTYVPFHEGDRESSFAAGLAGRTLFQVRATVTDSVNFQAQSHRFWHQRPAGGLVSTRLDFDYHHSWIGRFASCTFEASVFPEANLVGIECSGEGVTEAIESLTYTEQVVVWNAGRH